MHQLENKLEYSLRSNNSAQSNYSFNYNVTPPRYYPSLAYSDFSHQNQTSKTRNYNHCTQNATSFLTTPKQTGFDESDKIYFQPQSSLWMKEFLNAKNIDKQDGNNSASYQLLQQRHILNQNNNNYNNINNNINNNNNYENQMQIEEQQNMNKYDFTPQNVEREKEQYFDSDNLSKQQQQRIGLSSDYFDGCNRYRRLKQQNVEVEFIKAQQLSFGNINYNQPYTHSEYLQKYKSDLKNTRSVSSTIPQIKEFKQEQDNQMNNDSIDHMEAFEENNERDTFHGQQKNAQQNQDQISKFNINQPTNCANNKIIVLPSVQKECLKQEDQKILNQEKTQLINKEQQNEKSPSFKQSDQKIIKIEKPQIHLNKCNNINRNDKLNLSERSRSPLKQKQEKVERKQKLKAKSSLKAYFEQDSEEFEHYSPIDKRKKSKRISSLNDLKTTNPQQKCLKKKRNAQNQRQNKRKQDYSDKEDEDFDQDECFESDEEMIDNGYSQESDESSCDSKYNNSSTPTRGPYKKYSIKLKKKLVNLLEKGEQVKDISQKYDIPIKNLQRWKVYGAERREGGGRKIMDLNMEIILLEYCIDFALRSHCRCPRKIIMQKARDFTKEVNRFKGSKGWLDKYSARTRLSKIMTEYKQLKIGSESEIFQLVKQKSLSHIRNKIKSANPLTIFTSNQYLKFLEEEQVQHDNFWNINLQDYKKFAIQYTLYNADTEVESQSKSNMFVQEIQKWKEHKDTTQIKALSQLFGMTLDYFLECLPLQSVSDTVPNANFDQQSNKAIQPLINDTSVSQKDELIAQKGQISLIKVRTENKSNPNQQDSGNVLKNITNNHQSLGLQCKQDQINKKMDNSPKYHITNKYNSDNLNNQNILTCKKNQQLPLSIKTDISSNKRNYIVKNKNQVILKLNSQDSHKKDSMRQKKKKEVNTLCNNNNNNYDNSIEEIFQMFENDTS